MRKITSLLVVLFCLLPLWQTLAQEGNTCSDPIEIASLPYSTNDDTGNYTNEYSGPPGVGCGTASQYLSGNEAIYAYTATYTGELALTLNPEDTYAGFFVYNNCSDIGVVCASDGYATNGTSTSELDIMISVESGETYYIVVSMWAEGDLDSYAYTLNVEEVSCSRPGLVTLESVGFGETVISWEGNADSYEYVLSTASTEPTAPGTVTTDTEVVFNDLTEGQTYYFWVRSLCEEDDVSAWAAPVFFRSPGQGDTCGAAIEVASLPFTVTDHTNNFANEYTGTPGAACGTSSSYLDGNNVVYAYTATANTAVQILLESTAGNKGVFVYDDCESIGSLCNVGAVQSSGSQDITLDLYVETGETYYILLSTWPAPQTMPYTLSIEEITCAVPGDINLDVATPTTANFSWSGLDEADSYDYSISTSNAVPTAETGNTTESAIELTDLTPDTNYYFRVRTVCGATTTDWSEPFHFFTGYCTPVYTTTGTSDYFTKFEANSIIDVLNYTATSMPAGRYVNNSDISFLVYEGQTVAFNSEYTGGNQGIKIWIDTNDNMQFEELEVRYQGNSSNFSLPNNGQEGEFVIPAGLENGTYRMRVRSVYNSLNFDACDSQLYGVALDYTVEVVDAPTCPHVENITLDAATPTTATVSWDANASAEGYIVEYGMAGFEHGAGTTVEVTGTSIDLENLLADTNYEFYVRADCGEDDLSYWGSPLRFFTGYCAPHYTSASDYFTNIITEGGFINIDYSTSSKPENGYDNQAVQQVVVAPGMDFDMTTTYTGGSNTVKVWVDWNNNMAFEASEVEYELYNANAEKNFTINVPASVEPGNYRIRVASRWSDNAITDPCGTYSFGSTVDFTLAVGEEPECMPVSDLIAEAVSFNEIMVTWEGPDNADTWEVEYVVDNGPQGSGVVETATTNTITIDGLEGDTDYSIYVTPVCGTEEGFTRTTTVFTGYCAASTQYGEYLTEIMTDGGLSDIEYTATSQPAGGYDNQASTELVVLLGTEIDLSTIYSSGSHGLNVWVDWDNNLAFEEEEKVYTYSGAATQTGTLNFPTDLEVGVYRMRVRAQWGSTANPPPCGQVNYGSTVDFTLNVVELDCMPATDISFASDPDNNIIMSWTGNDDVAEWEIEYGVRDFTQGEGTLVTTGDTSYLFTDLELDTEYDFYIKGDCADEEGLTIGPKRFYFGYCIPTTQYSEHLTSIVTEGALTDIDYSSPTRPTGGYDNQSETLLTAFAGSQIDIATVYSSGSNGVNVWVDTDFSMTFEDDEKVYSNSGTNAAQSGSFNIPSDLEVGTYRMRVRGQWGSTANPPACGQVNYGSTVDFTLNIVELDCMPATDISFSADQNNHITMSWTGNDDVLEWEIEYGETGFTQGQGTIVTTTNTSYLFTNLELDTEYDFYIKGDCADEEGLTVGPKRFYFGFCTPTSSSGEYLSSITTEGGFIDLDYSASNQPSQGYDNQTDTQLVILAGAEIDITTVYSSGSNGVNAWIDWDNSLTFEDSEKVYTNMGSNATQGGSLALPEDVAPGNYRMRVRGQWGSSANPPACGQITWGSAVDFTLVVLDPSDCLPPLEFETTAVFMNAIEFTWIDNAENVESWEIEYGRRGFIQGEGTIIQTDTKPVLIDGLDSSSSSDFAEYSFYVRAICAGGDTGSWSPFPHTEATLCGPTSIPYILDFETSTTPNLPPCTSQQVLGNSNAWKTEFNPGYYLGETTVLRYERSDTDAADAWFFTGGVELEAGEWYTISYDYMTGNPQFAESLKVAMGESANAAAMTTELADYPEITVGAVAQDNIEFRVDVDGIYYFGFHAYSDAAQFALFLDNIVIDYSLGVEDMKDITFTMYPNPASSDVQVQSSNTMQRITVYNMLGQTVENVTPMDVSYILNVESLQAGTYLLEVEADGKRQTKRLIKK